MCVISSASTCTKRRFVYALCDRQWETVSAQQQQLEEYGNREPSILEQIVRLVQLLLCVCVSVSLCVGLVVRVVLISYFLV